jgi:glycosyltransferase involved in cell wall biosynthesis
VKILIVSPMPPDRSAPGAIPVLLHAGVSGLAERHSVTLITVAGPDEHELRAVQNLEIKGIEVHAVCRSEPQGRARWERRVRFARTWLRGDWPFQTVWYWDPRMQGVIDRVTTGAAFDVVLAEENSVGVYRFPAEPLRILAEHEVRRPRPAMAPPVSPRGWPAWVFRESDWRRWPSYHRAMWGKFDIVQVFTERDAEVARSIAPEIAGRLRVNPFSVSAPLPSPADEGTEPDTVAFLGNFSHPPNVDAALWLAREIMPRLEEIRPQVRLSIAGPWPPARLTSLAGRSIRVLGEVRDAEALMRRSAVIIAPVRTGGGMRMKVLSAMALGKPVVTTTRGSCGLMTADGTQPLVIADDAAGLARHTAELLADPAARERLGTAARRFVAVHHSPQAYARRLERIVAEARRDTDAGMSSWTQR